VVQAVNKKLKVFFLTNFKVGAAEYQLKNFTFKHLLTNFNQKLESEDLTKIPGFFCVFS